MSRRMLNSLLISTVILSTLLMQSVTVIGVTPARAAGAWQQVGAPDFASGASTSLAVYGGTPYVAYRDSSNGGKATLMKFNGTAWEPVGAAGLRN